MTTAKKPVEKTRTNLGPRPPQKPLPRITRIEMFVAILEIVKKRSTCNRNQVAAIIVKDNRIISMGYGGSPSNTKHCTEVGCLIGPDGGCIRTIHAESNAIAFSARSGISIEGSTMYTSLSPCYNCAKLIINSGISSVIFLEKYRDDSGIKLIQSVGISVKQYENGRLRSVSMD